MKILTLSLILNALSTPYKGVVNNYGRGRVIGGPRNILEKLGSVEIFGGQQRPFEIL